MERITGLERSMHSITLEVPEVIVGEDSRESSPASTEGRRITSIRKQFKNVPGGIAPTAAQERRVNKFVLWFDLHKK